MKLYLFGIGIKFDVYGVGGDQRVVEQNIDRHFVGFTCIYCDGMPCAGCGSSDFGLLKFDFNAVGFGGFAAQEQLGPVYFQSELGPGFDEHWVGFGDRFVESSLETRLGPYGKLVVGKIFHEPVGAGQ